MLSHLMANISNSLHFPYHGRVTPNVIQQSIPRASAKWKATATRDRRPPPTARLRTLFLYTSTAQPSSLSAKASKEKFCWTRWRPRRPSSGRCCRFPRTPCIALQKSALCGSLWRIDVIVCIRKHYSESESFIGRNLLLKMQKTNFKLRKNFSSLTHFVHHTCGMVSHLQFFRLPAFVIQGVSNHCTVCRSCKFKINCQTRNEYKIFPAS